MSDHTSHIHEFTKTDIEIDIEVKLSGMSPEGIGQVTDAYHELVQAIALFTNDYDHVQCSIADTRRQVLECIGAF